MRKIGLMGGLVAAAMLFSSMVAPAQADDININVGAIVANIGQGGGAQAVGKPWAEASVSNLAGVTNAVVEAVNDLDDINVSSAAAATGIVQIGVSQALAASCGSGCDATAIAKVSNLAAVALTDISVGGIDVVNVSSAAAASNVLQGGLAQAIAEGAATAGVTNVSGFVNVGVTVD